MLCKSYREWKKGMASSEWLFPIWQKRYSSFLLLFHQSGRIYGQERGRRAVKCNYSLRHGKSTYRNKNATFRGNHRSPLLVSNILFSLFYTWKTQSLLCTSHHLSRETQSVTASDSWLSYESLCSRSLFLENQQIKLPIICPLVRFPWPPHTCSMPWQRSVLVTVIITPRNRGFIQQSLAQDDSKILPGRHVEDLLFIPSLEILIVPSKHYNRSQC